MVIVIIVVVVLTRTKYIYINRKYSNDQSTNLFYGDINMVNAAAAKHIS